jgi:hypothetical protein
VGGWVFGKKVSLRTTSQLRWDVVKNSHRCSRLTFTSRVVEQFQFRM